MTNQLTSDQFIRDARISDFFLKLSLAPVRSLIVDYEGSLAPFAGASGRADNGPYNGFDSLLRRLNRETNTHLVIVAGRPAATTAVVLQLPQAEIWGCHGLERLKPDGTFDTSDVPEESLRAIEVATDLLLKEGFGPFVERKFGSVAIHWHSNEKLAGQLTRRVLHTWSQIQTHRGVRLMPVDGGLEITVATRSKSDAVQTILAELGADAAVAYLGDGPAAEDAFGALHGRGLNVLVRENHRRTLADVWIRPPHELENFLVSWIAACKTA